MTILRSELSKIHAYKAPEYNDYIMSLESHKDLEKILIYMIKNGWRERIRRTYSRYCVLRREFENKMIDKSRWYGS